MNNVEKTPEVAILRWVWLHVEARVRQRLKTIHPLGKMPKKDECWGNRSISGESRKRKVSTLKRVYLDVAKLVDPTILINLVVLCC